MRRTLLTLAAILALEYMSPAAAVAGDAPYQPYRGAYVYPRNRPVHHKYVVYYYVGGQRREAYRNYYAPVYPYYSDTAIRPGLYPDRSYPSYMQSGGYYYMTGSPGTAYSPY
jgi:hypothetical protein